MHASPLKNQSNQIIKYEELLPISPIAYCLINHHFPRRRVIAVSQFQEIETFWECEVIAFLNGLFHDFLAEHVGYNELAGAFHGEVAFGGVGVDTHLRSCHFCG